MGSSGEKQRSQRTVTIVNQRGLHARAAARFVRLAETFTAEITVSRDETAVSGRSIMGLMMLGAAPGCTITIAAAGRDAEAAVAGLVELVDNRFGET